jgi:hypothetical protein
MPKGGSAGHRRHQKASPSAANQPTISFQDLTQQDYEQIFAQRWITRDLADRAGIKRVPSLEGVTLIGSRRPGDHSGLAIPNIAPGETAPRAWRLRRDRPDAELVNGETRLVRRYLSAPGASNFAYFVPGTPVDQLINTLLPVVFTEGEFKAIALHRLSYFESYEPRFLVVGLNGVYGYRGTVGKDFDENGVRRSIKGVIADINRIRMRDRLAYIAYDADVRTKPEVRRARTLFAKELLERGAAAVRYVEIPPEANAKGIDDVLFVWGPDRVLEELIARAPSATARSKAASAYVAHDGRLWRKTVDRVGLEIEIALSNFVAQVIENRLLDNGLEEETQLVYRVRGQVNGSPPREFDLPHAKFREGDWEQYFGTKDAFVEVQAGEHVRRAISEISLDAPQRVAFRHLGHREIDGRCVYLHGPGAITSGGMATGAETSLSSELSRYAMRLPASESERREAILASLRTVNCASATVMYPGLAMAYRAPLGAAANVLAYVGPTGVLKTGLAAILLQHFGATMGWDGPPARHPGADRARCRQSDRARPAESENRRRNRKPSRASAARKCNHHRRRSRSRRQFAGQDAGD